METTLLIIAISLLVLLFVLVYFRTGNKSNNDFDTLKTEISRLDTLMRDEFSRGREETSKLHRENRDELSVSLKSFEDRFSQSVKDFNDLQRQKFDDLALKQSEQKTEIEIKLEKIRQTIETQLQTIREENTKKLEEMRATVDEKLQSTLEKRFNESFKLISDRLEQVHKGLGEMQTLASGVGDLKKVLSNVKTRGTLGEYQLGGILEQMLSPEQYEKNAICKPGSQERVEYVVKLPSKSDENELVLLPIDSKFPIEDYYRLIEAYDNLTPETQDFFDSINKQFENSVKKNAKTINEKYLNPPYTTDFAIMFVPTEGLYAEILRRTGLFEVLRRDFNITIVGPTNLVAFLSSLQMGFRTLAIEKRSSEVWQILGAVKTEFGRFGTILDKTKKKLQEAANVIDQAGTRSRMIEKKLKNVAELPQKDSLAILGEAEEIDEEEESNELT
ncbi:MAG: DNA recombination protein RmuC [Bacteroidetes bacterium HGW-Bacteroidetes-21]|jgi:DNA recombination protein RmuC|nr:MAG: DNA recombination protein RmuC [Bacteroidetes bacterium HGW-Bacteroidetes-21]